MRCHWQCDEFFFDSIWTPHILYIMNRRQSPTCRGLGHRFQHNGWLMESWKGDTAGDSENCHGVKNNTYCGAPKEPVMAMSRACSISLCLVSPFAVRASRRIVRSRVQLAISDRYCQARACLPIIQVLTFKLVGVVNLGSRQQPEI